MLLCPSDAALNMEPRTNAGNLSGFPVGLTNYKGVSGSSWGYDSTHKADFQTFWRHKGTNQSFDGLDNGDGILYRSDFKVRRKLSDIKDGLSYTFMIGEDVPDLNRWCAWPYANTTHGTCAIPLNAKRPDGRTFNPINWHNTQGFRSSHAGGAQFAMADCSVHFIPNDIDLGIYRALSTIRGNDHAELPD